MKLNIKKLIPFLLGIHFLYLGNPLEAQEQVATENASKVKSFSEGIEKALKTNAGKIYIDTTRPLEERVDALMNALSLEERVALIHCVSGFEYGEVPRLAIPSIGMFDGPQGVRSGYSTKFPCAIAMAASWDTELVTEIGQALGRETLAAGGRVLLAPAIDIVRTPLGGRTFEYFGEDPWLSGSIGVAYVNGVQSQGVGTCVKHFVGNNQERWRRHIDARISERALREIYLPAFKRIVTEGGAWSLMGAYNKVNGSPACENKHTLIEILREEWGFDGALVSDWGAWKNTKRSINGGATIEMTGDLKAGRVEETMRLLQKGEIDPNLFEEAVRRNIRFLIRCGIFDAERGKSASINTHEHQSLARRAAEESIVLLKNDRGILPLDPNSVKRLAVIGPNANWKLSRNNARDSGGSGAVFPPYEVLPLEGLRLKLEGKAEIKFVEGISYEKDSWEDFEKTKAEAVTAAKDSDTVIIFAGTNHSYDREATGNVRPENADKPNLGLIGPQAELIRACAAANPRTIVVLINGAPLAVNEWYACVPALMEAWFPGMEGGNAIANVLFGEVNPSGKLPLTFGKKLEDWKVHSLGEESYPGTGKGGYVNYDDGIWVGYRWFDHANIEPTFPFGYGLSYTTFRFDDMHIHDSPEGWIATFNVTNTGSRMGAEVPQLYVSPPLSEIERPVRELKGFCKVMLRPGEQRKVAIPIRREELRYWDGAQNSWVLSPGIYKIEIGNSSRNLFLEGEINIK